MYSYFLYSQSGKKFPQNKITTTTKSSKKTKNKEPNKKYRRLEMFVMIL